MVRFERTISRFQGERFSQTKLHAGVSVPDFGMEFPVAVRTKNYASVYFVHDPLYAAEVIQQLAYVRVLPPWVCVMKVKACWIALATFGTFKPR